MAMRLVSRRKANSQPQYDDSSEYDDDDFLSEESNEENDERHNALLEFCRVVGESDDEEFDPDSVPACERLSIRRKTGVALVKDLVPIPYGAVPLTPLPAWKRLSMDKKIPLAPAANRTIIFSRGGICENLHRAPKNFVNVDPYNKERVLTGSYNALHDPNARNYFSKPSVQKQLIRQGLVTPGGQVVCSLGEFNEFRSYLNNTVYNEDVNSSLDKANTQVKVFQDQAKKIQKEESKTEGRIFQRQEKLEKAKARLLKQDMEQISKIKERERIKEERVLRWKQELERKRIDRAMRAEQKERTRLIRLNNLKRKEFEIRAQKVHIIEAKEKAAAFRHYHESSIAGARREQQNLAWIEAKCEFQEEQTAKEELMETTLRRDSLRKAEQRQRRIESHRSNLHKITGVRKASERRTQLLATKYFDIWVNKVHRRRLLHPDADHESIFPVTDKMAGTVDELIDESGLEKPRGGGGDTFVDIVLAAVRDKGKLQEAFSNQEEEDKNKAEAEEEADEMVLSVEAELEEKRSKKEVVSEVEFLLDELIDDATEQYVQTLVHETVEEFMGEARNTCNVVVRNIEMERDLFKDEGPPPSGDGDHPLSDATESMDTIFLRKARKRPSVEGWIAQGSTEPWKTPDESVSVSALHPKEKDVPRFVVQGQAEQNTLQQFYQRATGSEAEEESEGSGCGPNSPASSSSSESLATPVPVDLRSETARSDGSSTSSRTTASSGSGSSILSIPKNTRSVQALRAAYEYNRSMLNRSSSPKFDYSSDEFLTLQTEAELVGNEALFRIAQETKALSTSESVTSVGSFSVLSEADKASSRPSLAKNDILDCVMTKQTMFSSVESYYDFTDVLYKEMAPLVAEKTLVQQLMHTLTTEENMKVFHQDFFQQLFSVCLKDEDIQLVQGLSKVHLSSGRDGSTYLTPTSSYTTTKAKSTSTVPKTTLKRTIMDTRSGPAILVSKKSPRFSPRKATPKPALEAYGDTKTVTELLGDPNQIRQEDTLMKGDSIELRNDSEKALDAEKDKHIIEEILEVENALASTEKCSELETDAAENNKPDSTKPASGSTPTSADGSPQSYSSASDGDELVPAGRKLSKLALKHLYTTTTKPLGANVYRTDGAVSPEMPERILPRHRVRSSPYLSSAVAEVKALVMKPEPGLPPPLPPVSTYYQPHSTPSSELVMHLTVRPRLQPLVPSNSSQSLNRSPSKSSIPSLPLIHKSPYSRPLGRPKTVLRTSTVPKLPEIPGLRKKGMERKERCTTAGNIHLPRLAPPQVLTLIMPGKARTFANHYLRRAPMSEHSKPMLGQHSLRSALSKTGKEGLGQLVLPSAETLDEVFRLIKTIVIYKVTQQVLYAVSTELLKETHFSERARDNIKTIGVRSMVKLALSLGRLCEERKYPKKIEAVLEEFKTKFEKLSHGIGSFILTSLRERNSY